MSIYNVVMSHRKDIKDIVEENNFIDPVLFGSVARQEDTNESDIDIMITPSKGASIFGMGNILWRLEELLGRKVDLTNDRTLIEQFRPYIEKDAIKL